MAGYDDRIAMTPPPSGATLLRRQAAVGAPLPGGQVSLQRGSGVFLISAEPCVTEGLSVIVSSGPGLHVVGRALSAASAFPAIRAAGPRVVIFDLPPCEGDGLPLVTALRRQGPDTAILVLATGRQPAMLEASVAAGANGFISRRAAPAEFLGAIQAVLAGGLYLEPALVSQLLGKAADTAHGKDGVLSQRELDVIRLAARGYTNKEISGRLGLGIKTVETYRARALQKLGIASRAGLVDFAIRSGWMTM